MALSGLALSTALASASLSAQVTTLTFEGLQNGESILNFYNGGTGSVGSSGVNFGVNFGANALALIDSDAGGSGDFGGEPSASTIMFFTSGSAVMNYPAGFNTGFSFFYSSPFNTGMVNVYDGTDGTGSLLASFPLATTPENGAPDPSGIFSPFVPVGVSFGGTARSVDFVGAPDAIGFDNITFGSAVPTGVPEPSTSAALVAVVAIGGHQWYRRRKAA
jgi:hypothetical protein